MLKRGLVLAALAAVLFVAGGATASVDAQAAAGHQHHTGEVLVGLKPDVPEHVRQRLSASVGGSVLSHNEDVHVLRLGVPGQALDAVIRALERNPNVEFAEPNYIAATTGGPNDPDLDRQWALERVRAPQAWAVTRSSASIRIAILDSGIDTAHPDLAGKVVAEANFSSSSTSMDVSGHGTHVAGIAGAVTNNGEGIASIGYHASLMNVKVMGDYGLGTYSDVIDGITWATRNGADVINMSFGGAASSKALERAVNQATRKGVILVAAAGNGSSSAPFYPAAYPGVIAVAATNTLDQVSSFSNYGDWVSIGAPGNLIWSTVMGGGYDFMGGTSMAAPHVSGLAALALAQLGDPAAVAGCILRSADDLGLPIGGGRMNAEATLECEPDEGDSGGSGGGKGRGKPR